MKKLSITKKNKVILISIIAIIVTIVVVGYLLYLVYVNNRHVLFHEAVYENVEIINTLEQNDNCAIIGGGVGGLSCAYYLYNSGVHDITLYEKLNTVSGNIKNYSQGCPMMMSCFDLPRSKHIHNLMRELGLQPTKCDVWKNITFKTGNDILVIPNYEKRDMQALLHPILFYKLVEAFSSINYFTNKHDFKFSQLLCYLTHHESRSFYSIENGNNYKLIERLETNLKNKIDIKVKYGVKNIKYMNGQFQLYFDNGQQKIHEKLILSIPPHHLKHIIDTQTTNNELLLIKQISECFYEQKSYTCLHTDETYCADNSTLTYTEISHSGEQHYILTINPRVFYQNNQISISKRITIWFNNENIIQINPKKILDEYSSSVSLLKSDKEREFIHLSKQLQNNKQVFMASSYLSFTRWTEDAIRMASFLRIGR